MILTEFQKEIVDKIISGEITNITSFLMWKCNDKKVNVVKYDEFLVDTSNRRYKLNFTLIKYDGEIINLNIDDLPDRSDIYFIDNFKPIGEFIALWNKLEQEKFVICTKCILNASQLALYVKQDRIIDIASTLASNNIKEFFNAYKQSYDELNKTIEKLYPDLSQEERENKLNELVSKVDEGNEKNFTYVKANESLDNKFLQTKYKEDYFFLIVNDELIRYIGMYIDKEIIPLIDLKEFKENNYQSISDLRLKSERRERRVAQAITIIISILSILLSIYTTFNKSNTEEYLNDSITKLYQSQEKFNEFLSKYDKKLDKYLK